MLLGTFLIWVIEFFAAFHVVYNAHELYEHKNNSPRGLFFDKETSSKSQALLSTIAQNSIYTWILSAPLATIMSWNEFDRKLAFFFSLISAITPVGLIMCSLFIGSLMLIIKILCKISKEEPKLSEKYKSYPIVKNIFMDGTQAIIAVVVAIKLYLAL